MNRPTYQIEMCTDGRHKVVVTFEDPVGSKASIAAAQGIYSQLVTANGQAPSTLKVDDPSDEGPPTCVVHHSPMTLVQGKQGPFWSCHKKNDDGSWCSYKPGPTA